MPGDRRRLVVVAGPRRDESADSPKQAAAPTKSDATVKRDAAPPQPKPADKAAPPTTVEPPKPSDAAVPPKPTDATPDKPADTAALKPAETPPPPAAADAAKPPAAPAAMENQNDTLRRLANDGNVDAMEELGRRYIQGSACADAAEGSKWMLRAAEKGSPRAMFNAGVMYERGFEVPKDTARPSSGIARRSRPACRWRSTTSRC